VSNGKAWRTSCTNFTNQPSQIRKRCNLSFKRNTCRLIMKKCYLKSSFSYTRDDDGEGIYQQIS